jgi:hypothetical protein
VTADPKSSKKVEQNFTVCDRTFQIKSKTSQFQNECSMFSTTGKHQTPLWTNQAQEFCPCGSVIGAWCFFPVLKKPFP